MADVARSIAIKHYRMPLDVVQKSDLSPVTIADQSIEGALRDLIRAHAPEVAIIGEEMATEGTGNQAVIIDPIVGTKSFITGHPLFGTLIAFAENGMPVCGMIEVPAMTERFYGDPDGAWLDGHPIRVSACKSLNKARFYTTSGDYFKDDEQRAFEVVSRACGLRRFGGDCYMYGLLAAGHCDLVIEVGLQTYDYMALAPVVLGAGGVMTDWDGAPLTLTSDGRVIAAATPELHAEVMAILHKS